MHVVQTAAGLALALAAAACAESGYVVQAAESRAADSHAGAGTPERVVPSSAPRGVPLLAALAARRGWRRGTALVVAGIVLQLAALGVTSVAVVQPTLILGLGLLVVLAERRLGERPGWTDRLGVAAAAVGSVLVAFGGSGTHTAPSFLQRGIAMGAVAVFVLAAYAIGGAGRPRRPRWLIAAAGAGDSLAVLAAKLLVDDIISRHWLLAIAWAAAAGAAGLVALSAEMRALQRLPATTVGPLVLAAQAAVPVLLAPAVVGEHWRSPALVAAGTVAATGAALILGRRRESLAEPGTEGVAVAR